MISALREIIEIREIKLLKARISVLESTIISLRTELISLVSAIVFPSPNLYSGIAGQNLNIADPVRTNDLGKLVLPGTDLADMLAFRGIVKANALLNGIVSFYGEGSESSPIFSNLTPGMALYLCNGTLITENNLQQYIDNNSGWYRRIGHAISDKQILQHWDEPQQI